MVGILISLLIALLILGIIAWVVQNFLPLDPPFKQLILFILVIIFVIWLLLLLSGQAPLIVPTRR
jgi:cation transporter-like permease